MALSNESKELIQDRVDVLKNDKKKLLKEKKSLTHKSKSAKEAKEGKEADIAKLDILIDALEGDLNASP